MEKDSAIEIENVVKEYRLGQIGSGTLRGDLQSFFARAKGKDDPNILLTEDQYYDVKNKTFRALDGVSLTVKKGEALGIIGRNGAGKSTLLKLISRITLPTGGTISYRGRVTSLLEVGTGFNGELTGRENIYMNGAILGMSKAEIREKIDKIIEFSEIADFIDTPVKRYSNGMYVKLAFAVAAHLDSDILLMDEILAVGDIKFQEKCLKRMNEASQSENRTVLYVSHNMTTIRQFCERCIALDKGKIIFDGDVEEAIEIYSQTKRRDFSSKNDLTNAKRRFCPNELVRKMSLSEIELSGVKNCEVQNKSCFTFKIKLNSKINAENVYFKFTLIDNLERPVGSAFSKPFSVAEGDNELLFSSDLRAVKNGLYAFSGALVEKSSFDIFSYYDNVEEMCYFEIPVDKDDEFLWARRIWGKIELPELKMGGDMSE